MSTETIEEFAGFVKLVLPYANIDGLYPPDLAHRLARALSELTTEDLNHEALTWVNDTALRLACCAEKAEAIRDELRRRGYSVPTRNAIPDQPRHRPAILLRE